jgi:leucyl aminopeptidase (aminopeptidase T)
MLIIADEALSDIAEIVWQQAKRITKNLSLLKYIPVDGVENRLSQIVGNSLRLSDACLMISTKYIEPSELDRARRNGCRFLVLGNATRRLIERSFATNYVRISMLSRKISDLLAIGNHLTLTSSYGTQISIAISKLMATSETGHAQNPGECSLLPAGESCLILKNSNSMNGRIVLNRLVGQRKRLSALVALSVKDGRVTQIKGQEAAEQLRKDLRKFGPEGRRIYEFGIGTNDKVSFGNTSQEDEKASGTIHISFGPDRKTKVHGKSLAAIKGIILKPTITIDGKTILKDGRFLI